MGTAPTPSSYQRANATSARAFVRRASSGSPSRGRSQRWLTSMSTACSSRSAARASTTVAAAASLFFGMKPSSASRGAGSTIIGGSRAATMSSSRRSAPPLRPRADASRPLWNGCDAELSDCHSGELSSC